MGVSGLTRANKAPSGLLELTSEEPRPDSHHGSLNQEKYGSPGPRAGAGGPHHGARSNSGHRDQPQLSIPADSGLTDGHQEQMLRDRAFKIVGDHPQVNGTVAEAVPDEASQRPPKIMARCSV